MEPSSPSPSHRPCLSPPPSHCPCLSPPLSLCPSPPSQLSHISFACQRQGLIPVKEKKRPRKPSQPRCRQPSSDDRLDEFLSRGCCCASKCFKEFTRDYYCQKRDEASSLSRDELDIVVIGQIMRIDDVLGPSHKHSPHQRQRMMVKMFYHMGLQIPVFDTIFTVTPLSTPSILGKSPHSPWMSFIINCNDVSS